MNTEHPTMERSPQTLLKPTLLLLSVIIAAAACNSREASQLSSDPDPPSDSAGSTPAGAGLQRGIDVSAHSGAVDWAAVVEAGHSFAFAKATEGVDLEDPAFEAHWQAMKDAGIVRGAYHFYVTEDAPEDQASFFIANVTLEPGDLAPVVDVELIGHGTQPGLPERLKTYLDLVESHYGVRPIIYTSPNFWDEHLTDEFGDYPLWVAEYGVDAPRLPSGWQEWHLWQYQDSAEVPGVANGADLSHLNRELDLSVLLMP